MCCFSQPVVSVSATNIFARGGGAGRQFLAYSMTVNADKELAMVLPLPVKPGTGENGVSFIDLSGYPTFFTDLRSGFPAPTAGSHFGCSKTRGMDAAAAPLAVVSVGNFEASFVPTLKDFSRLDERFRISDDAWKKLPQYHDYGFAVFKLKSGEMTVHPMAFSFLRRDPKSLFFPTVHIHDGEVHPQAEFDHVLYCQPREHEPLQVRDWRESPGNAAKFVKVDKAKGLVASDQHCYQKLMHGMLPNQDTLVANAA
jgi:hypothetical protein